MNIKEIIKKAEAGEELTVEEVKIYQATVKREQHVYGKYGTLAKEYLEKHNVGKLWSLADNLPEYLHGIDKSADDLHDTIYENLSQKEEYKRTGDYLTDVKRENAMKVIIEEEILHELVYVD